MRTIVMLGDSMFDNGVYTVDGSNTRDAVAALATPEDIVLNLAVDGARARDVPAQLTGVPPDVTDIFVSVGGNDLLMSASELSGAWTIAALAAMLPSVLARFAGEYRHILDALRAFRAPVTVCTVWNPRFDDPSLQMLSGQAVPAINAVITTLAGEYRARVVRLGDVCTHPVHYANEIEPSRTGSHVIATALLAAR
jgi:hypothetical protein